MFGILASMMHNATRTDTRPSADCDRVRRLHQQREDEARRRREALEELDRFRRGYW